MCRLAELRSLFKTSFQKKGLLRKGCSEEKKKKIKTILLPNLESFFFADNTSLECTYVLLCFLSGKRKTYDCFVQPRLYRCLLL